MNGSVLELSEYGFFLSASRGCLVLKTGKEVKKRIPFDLIHAVIVLARGTSFSHSLLCKLATHKIPLILCNSSFLPEAILTPTQSHYQQSGVHEKQALMPIPKKKQAWKAIIQAKLMNQAKVLELFGLNHKPLLLMAKKVKSGDLDNRESAGASRYWKILMGRDFTRDRNEPGINSCLNYGYTIIRASTIRAIYAAGLHPSFALHHKQSVNVFRLADDLMEPFRPLIDAIVYSIWIKDPYEELILDNNMKTRIVSLLHFKWKREEDKNSLDLFSHIMQITRDLAGIASGHKKQLSKPSLPSISAMKEFLKNTL